MDYSLDTIRAHYADKLSKHGHTPQGMDWKDEAAQMDRLNALCLLFHRDEGFTLNDWGCGYGRLAHMTKASRYFGYDIVEQELEQGEFFQSDVPTKIADYTVASGLFNVMDRPREEWSEYVLDCISMMSRMSIKGYAFNMLHARSDKKQDNLFYASPAWIRVFLPYCERVSIIQTYSPWDFTIICQK